MAIPTWTVGQVLTAADVNSWFVPLVAYKTANESVTSSTTLQNDDELFVSLAATAVYTLDMFILFDGSSTGDIKWKFTFPAGVTFNLIDLHESTPTVNNNANMAIFNQTETHALGCNGAGTFLPIFHTGIVTTTGTAGTLQLQWAQNTSNATATRVIAGSYMRLQRVG
jgi:hypothetical protein